MATHTITNLKFTSMNKLYLFIVCAFLIQVSVNSQPCFPEGIAFQTQEEIDSFQTNYPGCTEIEGNVYIDDMYSASITNLHGLNVLTYIGGKLDIGDNPALANLTGLEKLTAIGGDLDIHFLNNSAFVNLTGLDGLTTIGGRLEITHCNYLISLTGLNGLTYIGNHLFITYNLYLKSLAGMESVTTVEGLVDIMYNQSLTSLTGLEGLTFVENHLWIVDNDQLTCLLGLEGLKELGGSLHISQNANMTNLSGLDGLTSIGGSLEIEDNPVLISITGLEHINYIGGHLVVSGNDILPNLEGLNNITYIGGRLSLSENNNLTDLTGLNGLEVINGFQGLVIFSNANLTNLNGIDNLELVNGSIFIGILDPWIGGLGNPVLTDISALENLAPDSILSLNIIFNNSLSNCSIQNICHYLAASNSYVEIHDNAPGCNTVEEVEETCESVSVNEVSLKNEFSFYPNPATNEIFIESKNLANIVEIRIYNPVGQIIIKQKGIPNRIDISALNKGIYFVDIVSYVMNFRKKLIIN